jgi:hypothetical protein
METEYQPLDLSILNLLSSEPPTLAFDFFGFGGLPRSVFSLLNNIGDLEDIIKQNNNRSLTIPSLVDKHGDRTLRYEVCDSVHGVVANTYNAGSKKSDAKLLGTTTVLDSDGRPTRVTALGLEVYRTTGNNIWQFGFYISQNNKDIQYGEELITELPSDMKATQVFSNFMRSLFLLQPGKLPAKKGIVQDPADFSYLTEVLVKDARVIDEKEFRKNRGKWFRYLTGTMDLHRVIKFEDFHGYVNGYRAYSLELASTHLEANGNGKYQIYLLGNTELLEDNELDPNGKRILYPPYENHSEAFQDFLYLGNHLLNHIHINAGLVKSPFSIQVERGDIDLRYATVIKDKGGTPITIASYESPFRLWQKLPKGQIHHYMKIYAPNSPTLALDETKDWPLGLKPKDFMHQLHEIIPKEKYDINTFREKLGLMQPA